MDTNKDWKRVYIYQNRAIPFYPFGVKLTDNFELSEFFVTEQGDEYYFELMSSYYSFLLNIIRNRQLIYLDNIIRLADFLQKFRDEFNLPILITSGFRTPNLNLKVHGAVSSYHLLGAAADITFSGYSTYVDESKNYKSSKIRDMVDYLKDAKFSKKLRELIFHDTYIHIAL